MTATDDTVVLVSPPWYPVPPNGYGGIELIVGLLADAMRERGREVTVVAADGSPAAVDLAPREWQEDLGGPGERLRELTYAARLQRWLAERPVDLVHDHCGFGSLLVACCGRRPVVHTVHGPLDPVMRSFYSSVGDAAALVAVSEAQRATAPELNWTATVYNAVDVDALEIGDRADREDYLLCLARICADKGQDVAIEVARRTGRRLVLAGKVEETPEGRAFHEQRVLPFVDGEQVVHLGNVAGAEKARLLARATALLSPVRWPEPFGLALAEATCSGTPAIAFPNGAVPEVIDDGCTGFLVEDVDAMCEAVERAHDIDARAAAAHARRRFAPAAMVDGYLAVYDRVAASSRSHPG